MRTRMAFFSFFLQKKERNISSALFNKKTTQKDFTKKDTRL